MPTRSRIPAGICLAFALASLSAQAALPRYELFDLGALLGPDVSTASQINDLGQVIGMRGSSSAFLYTPGSGVEDVASLIGVAAGTPVSAYGINNLGHLTGHLGETGFVYRGAGSVEYLPAGKFGPNRINDAGVFIGSGYDGSSGYSYKFTPGTGFEELPLYDIVHDLNQSGQVAGYVLDSTDAGGTERAARHDAGGIDLLGTLGGDYSRSSAINAAGDVVGYAASAVNQQTAFLYTDAAGMVALDTFGLTGTDGRSEATAINDAGLIGGVFRSAFEGDPRAFLTDGNSAAVDLNTLLDPSAAGWVLHEVTDINNAGQIVGYGRFNGLARAFILNAVAAPVPEPETWVTMMLGVALLGVRRRAGRHRPGRPAP